MRRHVVRSAVRAQQKIRWPIPSLRKRQGILAARERKLEAFLPQVFQSENARGFWQHESELLVRGLGDAAESLGALTYPGLKTPDDVREENMTVYVERLPQRWEVPCPRSRCLLGALSFSLLRQLQSVL